MASKLVNRAAIVFGSVSIGAAAAVVAPPATAGAASAAWPRCEPDSWCQWGSGEPGSELCAPTITNLVCEIWDDSTCLTYIGPCM